MTSRDHSSRYSMKSSSALSAHCMSSNTRIVGAVSASRSKNSRHAANRFSRSPTAPLLEPEQVGEPRLDPARAPRGSGTCSSTRRAQLRQRARRGVLVLDDAGAPADHLGERPERDAVAVGEAPAAVPPDVVGEAVDVLLELPARAATCRCRRCRRPRRGARGAPRRTRGRAP